MLDSLVQIFQRLWDNTTMESHRFLYHDFNLNNRLTGLVGPRGVGKTTLLMQYIKQHFPNLDSVFYFSADHIYFKTNTLYEFVEARFLKDAVTTFFIDEVHKYDNWSQELKNLYDGFPTIKIVFSGSSSLDLVKGNYDLSRRGKLYHLPGLSFREYLNFELHLDLQPISFKALIKRPQQFNEQVSHIPGLLGHFHRYLKQGFYPFFREDALSYYEKLLGIVEKTIYEDISNFYKLKTPNLIYFSKILNYLAAIPPGTLKTGHIGRHLGIDDKTATAYLTMLQETGLVDMIYPVATGNQILRKPEKIFLNNTNLHYALHHHDHESVNIGTIRELAFIQSMHGIVETPLHHSTGDYQVQKTVFEIGGKNKTHAQIKQLDNAFLVKDDVVVASKSVIPLLFFGFLY